MKARVFGTINLSSVQSSAEQGFGFKVWVFCFGLGF